MDVDTAIRSRRTHKQFGTRQIGEALVRELLGLDENESVVSLIHLGPKLSEPPQKDRTPLDEVLRVLP